MLAFLLSAIEEYSEAPDIPEGSGASSISDSAMILPVRWMSTAIVHGVRRASIKQPSNSSTLRIGAVLHRADRGFGASVGRDHAPFGLGTRAFQN